MIFELIEDIVKMALIVASLYFVLRETARTIQPAWSEPLVKRRLITLWALILALSASKLTEDVVGGESGSIDKVILLFIHGHVPRTLTGFFEAVTLTGSPWVLFPLVALATIALLWARHRYEARLIAASVSSGALVTNGVKTVVGRARPLCGTQNGIGVPAFPVGIRSSSRDSPPPPRSA